ncbi:7SK snRNA methylphosphate capping enzyme-like isoform X2 [Antedon mediterranea]|uniref:7SK snRNA methylphosphate capping enzyme-like isoform X2 n=1 Tax=Antedon mediterranea TaxID=105859 RepID=UPI003AF620AE
MLEMASVETQSSLNGIRAVDSCSKSDHFSGEVISCSRETTRQRHSSEVGPGMVSDSLPRQLCEKLKGLEENASEITNHDSRTKCDNKDVRLKKHDENTKGNVPYNNNTNRVRSKRQSLHYPSKNPGFIRKRRRTTEKICPTKFLLGGNLHDPLNLNSLANQVDEKTPATSPLPQLNKDPDPVIIPRDITDPLKLNSVTAEDEEPQLTTTIFSRKFGSGKKKKRLSRDKNDDEISDRSKRRMLELNLDTASRIYVVPNRVIDKIVSPVLPETVKSRKRKRVEPTNKIAKALLIETDDVTSKTDNKRRKISPEKSKYRRQNSKDKQQQPKKNQKFKEQNKKFQYGNYTRYYGYRNAEEEDVRLVLFRKEWFEGKACLDIGCNTGHVTLYIAKNLSPSKITGIDIDSNLIGIARKNIKQCLLIDKEKNEMKTKDGGQFPDALTSTLGPVKELPNVSVGDASSPRFPANVMFRCANFVLEKDEYLSTQKPEYDVIMCLSMTKWVHLNWGDAGLKRMFRRIFLALRPGGQLILEPQSWSSYCKKKKETTYKNFYQLQLRPEHFKDYLLRDVGFIKCECLGTPLNPSKGFRRPILMFTKASQGQEETEDIKAASTSRI